MSAALPIIDAHHHVWRRADLPWLSGPMQPRIFGPYEPIRRDYGIEEYRADAAGTGIVGSIYVQANWAPERFEDEVAFVQRLADETGWPQAIVGYADCTVSDVRPQLDRLAKYPLIRGVRQQFHWHDNPLYRFAGRPDLVADDAVRRNVGALADYGFSFDLQVFTGQTTHALRLVTSCPKVTFVLQHAGMPEDLSDHGREGWRAGLKALARRPNVVSKLSALGTFIRRNDPDHIRRIVADTIAIFGAERCLFGSNFPIEKLWTDLPALVSAYRAATARLPEQDIRAVFHDTAQRIYRVGGRG